MKGKIFDFFAEPSYFLALQDNRPCVLEGGRGTGKTTVLRGLSYHGQYALHEKDMSKFDKSEYIGIYHRIDTNHVRAFTGGGLTDEKWMKIFAHYFNLIICREVLLFINWHHQLAPADHPMNLHACKLIAKSMHIGIECTDLTSLIDAVDVAMYEFQSKVNNIGDCSILSLSMAGDPIKIVTEQALSLQQFTGKMFFILLDEYENYTDYQQQIVNSLIKHSTDKYTFKIGVRELGWRIKHTLNPAELLHDPADYVLINIERKLTSDDDFEKFAKDVCQQRIKQLFTYEDGRDEYDIENALGNLTIEEEAELLDVTRTEYWKSIQYLDSKRKAILDDLPKLYIFFLSYWARWHVKTLEQVIDEYIDSPASWNTRYENYKYSMLFKIRKGRGTSGIQKYFSGWSTYTKLASGNIRCLIELVYRAYEKHLTKHNEIGKKVSFENQTKAAEDVGKKNLMELEGLWKNGAQLTRLLLGMGRIFQVLARYEGKQSPEVNQFDIENSESLSDECKELLDAAVMNLALVRSPGNKLDNVSHTRDYIYSIHPIYSPYFVFSHRKKRKMTLTQEEVLGVISKPKDAINSVLKKRRALGSANEELPIQMSLFEMYYNG